MTMTTIVATAVLSSGLLLGGGAAVAATTTPTTPTTSTTTSTTSTTTDRKPAACARVDTALNRARATADRLAGPDTAKGSIARLQSRADAATTAGKTQQARVLTDLLEIRKARAQANQVRVTKLADIQQACQTPR